MNLIQTKKTMACIVTGLLLMAGLSFSAVTITNYSGIPSGYAWIFNGIGSSAAGVVYCGSGNRTGGDAVLMKASPTASTLTVLGYCKTVSQAAGNWQTLDTPGKIHSQIYEYNGLMYFGSHSASEPADEGQDSIMFINGFRGGHLYSYNPSTNTMLDVNAQIGVKDVAIPHQGILDIAIDKSRGFIYSIGYPFGHIWRHNLATGADDSVAATGQRGGGTTRHLIIDNAGRVFWLNGQVMMRYNPLHDSVQLKPYIVIRNRTTGSGHIQSVVYSPSGDSIYFNPLGEPHIYRFLPLRDTVETIADDSTMAMTGRFDIGKLFWSSGRNLKMHDIATGVTTTVYTSMPRASMGCNGTDVNGNLVFAVEAGGPFFRVNLGMPVAVEDFSSARVSVNQPDGILQAYPNPFTGGTLIRLPSMAGHSASDVQAAIYDIAGKVVEILPFNSPGHSEIRWVPAQGVRSGVYFCVIANAASKFTARLNFVK